MSTLLSSARSRDPKLVRLQPHPLVVRGVGHLVLDQIFHQNVPIPTGSIFIIRSWEYIPNLIGTPR